MDMVGDTTRIRSVFQTGGDPFQDILGKARDRVIINVGGSRHETYISTIRNFPDTRLFWIAETASKMVDFDPEKNEFFFDRHPGCFENILNYCRTGKLHCPNDVCGPLFEEELAFWGIDELQMEPCCWGTYTQHRSAHKHLKMFDKISGLEEEEVEPEMPPEDIKSGKFLRWLKIYRPIVWSTLERPYSSKYAQVAALVSLGVIILSIASFCLETMPFAVNHQYVFRNLEYFYCVFFTFDFFVRLLCCPELKKFFSSVMSWIDLSSIIQFYINFFTHSNALDFLFVLRLIRIFRLFRFFKNLSGMQVIGQTLKASARELFLLVLIVLIPMVIFSSLVYFAERTYSQGTFGSIPEAFWWAIITMTTVGYGDVTPHSSPGKIIGALCACSGVLILALPVSVIGSNFTLYYSYAQARLRLPKRQRPALVLADKALVNAKLEERQEPSPAASDESDPDDVVPKRTPRCRRPAIAVTSMGVSGGKGRISKDGMVSSGLRALSDVMVELAVPIAQGKVNPTRSQTQTTEPTRKVSNVRQRSNTTRSSCGGIYDPSNDEKASKPKKRFKLRSKWGLRHSDRSERSIPDDAIVSDSRRSMSRSSRILRTSTEEMDHVSDRRSSVTSADPTLSEGGYTTEGDDQDVKSATEDENHIAGSDTEYHNDRRERGSRGVRSPLIAEAVNLTIPNSDAWCESNRYRKRNRLASKSFNEKDAREQKEVRFIRGTSLAQRFHNWRHPNHMSSRAVRRSESMDSKRVLLDMGVLAANPRVKVLVTDTTPSHSGRASVPEQKIVNGQSSYPEGMQVIGLRENGKGSCV